MNFEIAKNSTILNGEFKLEDDMSLLFVSHVKGDYTVLLGKGWRFELIVDSKSGKCLYFQSSLDDAMIKSSEIVLPSNYEAQELIFISDEKLISGYCCNYAPFIEDIYYDNNNKILCFGDKNFDNCVCVEFARNTIAVIKNKQILAIVIKNINIEIK